MAIARALANEPKILLADEPTGSLDSASTARFLDLLRRLESQGMTIVMVTHVRTSPLMPIASSRYTRRCGNW